ncbi:hypothetical protein MSAN_01598600 [Mycena sanguinolenta]|uniref:Uncharacterized protein n=1 Tax=Mycena sanguinolenta TaxID=230812 RepID=A0A8H6Y3C2_9AGAR|nr:hypothetical protein MSAN_01598600 [Mycena sanguinolenta]
MPRGLSLSPHWRGMCPQRPQRAQSPLRRSLPSRSPKAPDAPSWRLRLSPYVAARTLLLLYRPPLRMVLRRPPTYRPLCPPAPPKTAPPAPPITAHHAPPAAPPVAAAQSAVAAQSAAVNAAVPVAAQPAAAKATVPAPRRRPAPQICRPSQRSTCGRFSGSLWAVRRPQQAEQAVSAPLRVLPSPYIILDLQNCNLIHLAIRTIPTSWCMTLS